MNDIVLTNDQWIDILQIIFIILFFMIFTLVIGISMNNITKHKDKKNISDLYESINLLKQDQYNMNKLVEEKNKEIQDLNKEIIELKKCTYCKYNKETGTEKYSFFRCVECNDQKKKFEYKE